LDTQGHILGRKFYYHHQDYRTTREFYRPDFPRNLVIETREGSFTFKVHFENLSDDELAILAYSLHLEDGIAHHFGFGKALGLGAVKIEITEMSLWSFQTSPQGIVGPSRFLSYKLPDSSQRTESPGYWAEKGRRLWGSRGPSADQARNKFLEILKWPQTENFKYPGRDWFSKVQGVTLAEYQGRVHQMAPGTAAQPQPGTRLRGTVKTVSPERGFAFVTSPSGTDVYVPLREVRDQEPLQLGQEVEFTLGTDAQGRHQARAVVIVRR
ncbi:MAG: cold shock domain-containing protein, partial [Deltaproteobacteria bacterium]|nr:cold shock domain-containing protein [Deltaproteobacteria bacterium]